MNAIRMLVIVGALLLSGNGKAGKPDTACPVQGEVIQWIADYCMFKLETDDEIAASECIAGESKIGFASDCAAKTRYKRALCGLSVARDAKRGSVERCVADRSFMGRTVRNGGAGAQPGR